MSNPYSDFRRLERLIGYEAYNNSEEKIQVEDEYLIEGKDYKILGTYNYNLNAKEILFEEKD